MAELGIKSPLRDCGFTKQDIRVLSKALNLPTWEKQSFACLSSRFVYGETISEEKLTMVDKAEQLLLDLGFHQVRVRIHGMMARIEIEPEEFSKLMEVENRERIIKAFREYGFTYVTLDHRLSFYIGSILPDCKPSFVYKKHEINGTFPDVKKMVNQLIFGKQQGELTRKRRYYMNLGQVTHYVADYFTYPHNKIYPGNLKDHCSYEEQLKRSLKNYIK